jgi:uncharacterized cupredoxin-like copper-binding protein
MYGSSRAVRTLAACICAAASVLTARDARAQAASASEHIQYALVTAKDYAFEAPAAISEGIVTFHLVNQGSDVHQLSVVEIGAGHSIKDFFDYIRANHGAPPSWATTVGMTGTIAKGAETFLTVRLAQGKYVLSCLIPAMDGRSHVEKGMYQYVTVGPKAAPAPAAKAPPATKAPAPTKAPPATKKP